MRKHLAIMRLSTIEAILSGKKTIETRFSLHRISPFGQIGMGDLVYMKPPGEDIVGQFKVKKVFSYEGLSPQDLEKIFADFGAQIGVGDKKEDQKYQQDKKDSKFGTLIFIGESDRFLTPPVKIKKKDLRGWVVLG
ncbi:MAG: hypothetical protein V1808_03430 [Candidatus Daviesbacteria bacterium]